MIYKIAYQGSIESNWSPEFIFASIDKLIREKYPQHNFDTIISRSSEPFKFPGPGVMAIINQKTDNRIILSYMDLNRCVLLKDTSYGWFTSKIKQLFFCTEFNNIRNVCETGNNSNYFLDFTKDSIDTIKNHTNALVPFFYPVYNSNFDTGKVHYRTNNPYHPSKHREQKMFFRGFLWEPRLWTLTKIHHPEINYSENKVYENDYYKYLDSYRCGFSLNGSAEICNRDIEYMALGIPVIRPLLKHTVTHDPLIPNVHYVSYDFDRQELNNQTHLAAPKDYDYGLVAAALIDRWESVKYDYEFLDYIGNNALNWYNKNAVNIIQAQTFVDMANLDILDG